ncbi:hypothetical protein ACFPID_01680, partial [Bifidobacterium leontopitheci]
ATENRTQDTGHVLNPSQNQSAQNFGRYLFSGASPCKGKQSDGLLTGTELAVTFGLSWTLAPSVEGAG